MSKIFQTMQKTSILSQSRRLPLLQVVSNNKSFSVGVQSPTEINAPRGCAVILRRICQLSLTRITHQVSRAFDLKVCEQLQNLASSVCTVLLCVFCWKLSLHDFSGHILWVAYPSVYEIRGKNTDYCQNRRIQQYPSWTYCCVSADNMPA